MFLERLNEEDNYAEDIPDELKEMAKVAVFNIYIDYIFTLKLTYSVYGENYDVIMKGHPREAIGCYEEWNNRYKFKYGDGGEYVYDKLLDSALMAFHQSDSIGKKIGMVPYGTAAENLAYLGADIAIAGLPSSTYSGFDTDVDVLFIIAETDEDISGSGNDEAVSQVKARYEAGNLLYTDGNGEKKETVFYNTGNVFKTASDVYSRLGDESMAEKYDTLFELWMDAAYGDTASDINEQGFPKK